MERKPWLNKKVKPNQFIVTYLNGPRVEVKGDENKEYFIEFIDRKTIDKLNLNIENKLLYDKIDKEMI